MKILERLAYTPSEAAEVGLAGRDTSRNRHNYLQRRSDWSSDHLQRLQQLSADRHTNWVGYIEVADDRQEKEWVHPILR